MHRFPYFVSSSFQAFSAASALLALAGTAAAATVETLNAVWPVGGVQTVDALMASLGFRGINGTRMERQSFTVTTDTLVKTLCFSATGYGNQPFRIAFYRISGVNDTTALTDESNQVGSTITVDPFGSTQAGQGNLRVQLTAAEQFTLPALTAPAGYVVRLSMADTANTATAFQLGHSNNGTDLYSGGRYRRDDGNTTNTRDFGFAIIPQGDTDSDGLSDFWEDTHFGNGDGTADAAELALQTGAGDPDSDGATNEAEETAGSNPNSADTDNDGLNDGVELSGAQNPFTAGVAGAFPGEPTRPTAADSDGDGIPDGEEVAAGADTFITNPNAADTDADTLPDGWETTHALSPVDSGTGNVVNGSAGDPDTDGLDNAGEYLAKTNPRDADTDDDTLNDGAEVTLHGTSPLRADTDSDTIPDAEEVAAGADGFVTDPLRVDTDGDGVRDPLEIANGSNPTDPQSVPANLSRYIASVSSSTLEVEGLAGTHLDGTAFGEDVLAYTDRLHQWNGATVDGLPPQLVGGDYVVHANDSRGNAAYTEDVVIKAPASVYLLVDNRVQLQAWATDGVGLDFTDTGLDVGIDENSTDGVGIGPGVSLNNTASVYIARDTARALSTTILPGTYTFGQSGSAGLLMYGIVATAPVVEILSAGFSGSAFEITFSGLSTASTYQFQRSEPGLDGFTSLGSVRTPAALTEVFRDPAPPAGKAFYRLVRTSP